METLLVEIVTLAILAIPVACVSWTVTHEEVFREPREFCVCRSKDCRSLLQRKFFYLFTCEYCFSHYVAILFLILTQFHVLYDDWRGYMIAGFALVWVANQYMSLYNRLRLDIRAERSEAVLKEQVIEKASEQEAPAAQAAAHR